MPIKLEENLFLLSRKELFCNVYLIRDKKVTLIDSGLKSGRESLVEMLKKIGIDVKDVDYVLHTHGHVDHFSNSKIFKNAKLLMQKKDAELVNRMDFVRCCGEYFDNSIVDWPKVKFLDSIINLGKIKLKVLHTPGHSKGSVCFLEENRKWLFSGDTLFKEAFGRFDLPNADRKELIKSLKKLYSLAEKEKFSLLMPGHGKTLKGLNAQKKNLKNLLFEF